MSKAANEVHLGPNLSHIIPAGKPREIPKLDIDPRISTEMTFDLYYSRLQNQPFNFITRAKKRKSFLQNIV